MSAFSFNSLQLHVCIHPMKSLNTFWFECLILLFFITLFYGLWLFLQHFDWLLFTLNLISFLYLFPFLYQFPPPSQWPFIYFFLSINLSIDMVIKCYLFRIWNFTRVWKKDLLKECIKGPFCQAKLLPN